MNMIFKCVAWYYTQSHSMFAEAIHSLADTMNQVRASLWTYTCKKKK